MVDLLIRRIDADAVAQHAASLATLLIDAVEDGASVGFLPPEDPRVAPHRRGSSSPGCFFRLVRSRRWPDGP